MYDIIIIGGGAAGMMAGLVAGGENKKVVILEKNDVLGKKLLITGKGRCNITNNERDVKNFIDVFGKNGKFLYGAMNQFGVEDTINFFQKLGIRTKVERGGRVFPITDSARDVRDRMLNYLRKNKVEILTNARVKKLVKKDNKIEKVILEYRELQAKKYIVATGGMSYSTTGSSGDGYKWARELGHTVILPKPALSPVKADVIFEDVSDILDPRVKPEDDELLSRHFCESRNPCIKNLEGLSLKNVKITVISKDKKIDERFGEAIFTSEGMSGPIILDMSKTIGENLPGNVTLKIDFKPALTNEVLDQRIQRDFKEFTNKQFKNSLDKLLPKKLIPVIIKLSEIGPEKKVNIITKQERKKLVDLLKNFSLKVKSLEGFKKSIITSGGINLKEINPKTMQSKLINNLYFAGEILDLDAPTGGYNLQLCWTTAYLTASQL